MKLRTKSKQSEWFLLKRYNYVLTQYMHYLSFIQLWNKMINFLFNGKTVLNTFGDPVLFPFHSLDDILQPPSQTHQTFYWTEIKKQTCSD